MDHPYDLVDEHDGFDDELHLYRDDDDLQDDENINFDDYARSIELEEERGSSRIEPAKMVVITTAAAAPVVAGRKLNIGEEISELASQESQPRYLMQQDNAFELKMTELISSSGSSIHMHDLRQYAILVHQLRITELHQMVWGKYAESGTGTLLDNQGKSNRILKLWPDEVKSIMVQYQRTRHSIKDIDDNACYNYVQHVLRQLRDRIEQYENELEEQRKRHQRNLTSSMIQMIHRFVDDIGTFQHRSIMNAKLTSLKHDSHDRLLELEFHEQNPQTTQLQLWNALMKLKYERERTFYEIRIFKHRLTYNQPPTSYDTIQLPLPTSLTHIHDFVLRQTLNDRCEKILQRTKSDLVMVHITLLEYQLKEQNFQLEQHLQVMEGIPIVNLPYQHLTTTMIDIVQRRFNSIEERLRKLYQCKKRFFSKTPMVTNSI